MAELTKGVVEWRKIDPEQVFHDGDQLLVAVSVRSRFEPNKFYWDYAVVRISCDEDHFDVDTDGRDWGWSWSDVEWWMPLSEFALPQVSSEPTRQM